MLDEQYAASPRSVGANLQAAWRANNHEIFTHEIDGQLIAATTLFELRDGIYFAHEVIVHPDFRGQGFGAAVMDDMHTKRKGIILSSSREANVQFYKKLDYVRIGDKVICRVSDSSVVSRERWAG